MANTSKNKIWASLASVKLALLLIGLLASTSIIGTVIQQNKAPEHYVTQWGENPAKLIQKLNFDDMYNSIWFLSLLGAFSLNLTICSIDRIPTVIRMVRRDNLTTDPERLSKMKPHQEKQIGGGLSEAKRQVAAYLAGKGWKTDHRDKEDGTMFFAQKGGWTRYGVYIVHISILIILLGAIIGSSKVAKILKNPEFAFKGGVSLPETAQSDFIFSSDTDGGKIPLGFTVRCNFFNIDFYPNGMPKDYVSGLTILESGKEVLTKTIEVNKPLTYKGITFYQASYNDIGTPIIKLRNTISDKISSQPNIFQYCMKLLSQILGRLENDNTGTLLNKYLHIFPVDPKHFNIDHTWREGDSTGMIRIQSVENVPGPGGRNDTQLKIWMMDSTGPPSMFTMIYKDRPPFTPVIVERPDTNYELSIIPHYATGLQVSKDPGVWWVYSGFGLMLIGLCVTFFMSHRKIWVHVYKREGQPVVIFAGNANKNKLGFTKTFSALTDGFKAGKG